MTNEAQFCEDYIVRFILMYNIIDKDELEDIETKEPDTENISRDGATHVVIDSDSEISLYDIFTSAINKYVESEN